MGRYWEAGESYRVGDVVKYEGNRYKVIQGHDSQDGWRPNLTPALWEPLDAGNDGDGDGRRQYGRRGHGSGSESDRGGRSDDDDERKYRRRSQRDGRDSDGDDERRGYRHRDERGGDYDRGDGRRESPRRHQDEREDGHYGEPPRRPHEGPRHQEERGLDSGYQPHDHGAPNPAQAALGAIAQAQAIIKYASEDDWLADAAQRSSDFKQNGPKGPTTWLLVEGGAISRDAIVAGEDSEGNVQYVSRVWYQGGLHIGKASSKGASFGWGGREVAVGKFEVLLGDARAIKWVQAGSQPGNARPVEGGFESDGRPLYVGQTQFRDEILPAKAWGWAEGAVVAYKNEEYHVEDYKILTYV